MLVIRIFLASVQQCRHYRYLASVNLGGRAGKFSANAAGACSTDKDQVLKLLQELGELSDSVCKGTDLRDDLGDMLVVMINIMKRNNLTIDSCLEKAYNDIKDRKGKMIDGVFVKQ